MTPNIFAAAAAATAAAVAARLRRRPLHAAADAAAAAAAVPCGSVAAAGKKLNFSDVFFAFSRFKHFATFWSVFGRFKRHAFGCFFMVLEPSIPWSEY